jgi:acyl-CoA ligase (AMP-forming) (exosortase A-associated)
MPMQPYLLHHGLERAALLRGKTAVVDGSRSLSYAAFWQQVEAMAGRLVAAGVQRGARVGILLPKCLEECVAIYATSRADCVFVPINIQLKAGQVGHILRDCGADALITCKDQIERVEAGAGISFGLKTIILVDQPDHGVTHVPDACAIGEDLAAILYTSGSTGLPKGVMVSHRNLLAGSRIVRRYLGITAEERILSLLPFSFDYGLNQLVTAVDEGATLVLFGFRFGDEIVRAIETHGITGLAGVPTIWAILTRASPLFSRKRLSSLRYITNSGGAVPTETIRRMRELQPDVQLFLMYGLTEAFRSTFLPPSEVDARPQSIGKAIPECEVFAVTADGRRAGPGETGILVHRGPTVSLGYWNRPDDTARVLRPHPFRPVAEGGETVCYSGDLVTLDADGFFYFVGRNDAMIKSAGHRISPTEVEEVLMASGQLRQVAVIGLPDAWTGQKVHAVGVAANGSVDIGTVLACAGTSLPSYMVPAGLELVDSLPTTPNGKVDYKLLLAQRSGQ